MYSREKSRSIIRKMEAILLDKKKDLGERIAKYSEDRARIESYGDEKSIEKLNELSERMIENALKKGKAARYSGNETQLNNAKRLVKEIGSVTQSKRLASELQKIKLEKKRRNKNGEIKPILSSERRSLVDHRQLHKKVDKVSIDYLI